MVSDNRATVLGADRHFLYQEAVQEPEADVEFFEKTFREEFGRSPRVLREDFCGTGYLACTWVQQHSENRAIGVDLDPDPIAWGRENNLSELKPKQRTRLRLEEGNALDEHPDKADVIAALNFSFFTFKTRDALRAYFKAAYDNLGPQGILVADMMGGLESQDEHCEETEHDDFTYIWEQLSFNPLNHELKCAISFKLSDESLMRRAFEYDWRLWTAPEIKEIMIEAGFAESHVYWEGDDEDSEDEDGNLEGNGEFSREECVENCDSWIAYMVGIKK